MPASPRPPGWSGCPRPPPRGAAGAHQHGRRARRHGRCRGRDRGPPDSGRRRTRRNRRRHSGPRLAPSGQPSHHCWSVIGPPGSVGARISGVGQRGIDREHDSMALVSDVSRGAGLVARRPTGSGIPPSCTLRTDRHHHRPGRSHLRHRLRLHRSRRPEAGEWRSRALAPDRRCRVRYRGTRALLRHGLRRVAREHRLPDSGSCRDRLQDRRLLRVPADRPGSGPGFSFTHDDEFPTLTPQEVIVVGPGRASVGTWSADGSETITKGSQVFSNAVDSMSPSRATIR